MNNKQKDYAASVLARLLNRSRIYKEDYQSLLIRYVAERFLYRLGQSEYRSTFVLKGAYLLTITLEDQIYRTTKDIDFLKTGETDSELIHKALKSICEIPYSEDGVRFDTDSIILQDIQEQNAYQGQRAKISVLIGKARIVLQIDIGIGDSVYPAPISRNFPSLLGFNSPNIVSYPIETVIAEKLEAIIALSLLTSRMKDFYDLYVISYSSNLDYSAVKIAIENTFKRRGTPIPNEVPVVLSKQVYEDVTKKQQWKAFVSKLRNEHSNLQYPTVIKRIQDFTKVFWIDNKEKPITWNPGIGWTK
ncbi:MAG: nucleotidyl transferase AbiEii/AbiGii toxin family protein [Clostridiales bacterium]|nr:nucleotidyl transferase AbiEii/AbiGii toxin family protein [Clostridiales bacterium]